MASLKDFLFHEEPGITLYCGDATEILPLLRCPGTTYCLEACDGRCGIAAVVTDPPFNVRAEAWDTFASPAEFLAFTCAWMIAAAKIAPLVASFFPDKHLPFLRRAAELAGLPYRRALVWSKPPGSQYAGASLDGFWYDFEIVNVFGTPRSNGRRRRAEAFGVMEHRTVVAREHSCEKPEALLGEIVSAYVPEGLSVVDPFAGIGTTLVAAKERGRQSIGIEIEPRYCEIAVKRLRQEVLPFAKEFA